MSDAATHRPPRSAYFRLALYCIVPAVVPAALLGLALHGADGAIFFGIFGLVLGVLAMGFGLLVGRWSHRHPRPP
jgi:undecaprenyl pyrophosphate phosphatase UppP